MLAMLSHRVVCFFSKNKLEIKMFSKVSIVRLAPRDLARLALRPVTSSSTLHQSQPEYEWGPPANGRPRRLENPPKVRMGFIPDSWFTQFYPKTGVTGPYVFGATVLTYLFSKEIWVMDHEFRVGLAMLSLVIPAMKIYGPKVKAWADKTILEEERKLDQGRENEINFNKESIAAYEQVLWCAEGQKLLIEAKRENVALQVEAAYRERLMNAYNIVKKRLDYQLEKVEIERRIAQRNLVEWVVQNVLKSITPQQEKDTLAKCVADLNALAARA